MNRKQRYRYEMFVRVRDFGAAHPELFPESSKGGRLFGQVAAAVAAVEDHLTRRDRARVEARRVKATTRAAVTRYMVAIARTARRVTVGEPGLNPFRLAGSHSVAAVLAKARLFIEEARPRETAFVELGLAPTFISDFTALVDQLDEAVAVRLNGRGWRLKAQTGIENALRSGADAIANLDVLVPNALHDDPVREGHWRGARRIEGQGPAVRVVKPPVMAPADVPPAPTTADPPAAAPASPPAVEGSSVPDTVAPSATAEEQLERAS
jgi:hypothetical protein